MWFTKYRRFLNKRSIAGFMISVLIIWIIANMGSWKHIYTQIMNRFDFRATDTNTEQRHIAFLKVHKTASTTVQNIFLRFGWQRNLTFVLPSPPYFWGLPNVISVDSTVNPGNILKPPEGRHYDILCSHVLYSYQSFRGIMPHDTVNIGIVREPYEQFKSSVSYLKPEYILKGINTSRPVDTYLRDPSKYEPRNVTRSWTNNRMALEFGFPSELFRNYDSTGVDAYLKRLDAEFGLVIVTELLDESCVLMRRLLRWQTKDILHVTLNKGKKLNDSLQPSLGGEVFYRRYAKLDYDLYHFFYRRLHERMRNEGSDFEEEVVALKTIKRDIAQYCMGNATEELYVPRSAWSESFYVSLAMCRDMKRDEIAFIKSIGYRQYRRPGRSVLSKT